MNFLSANNKLILLSDDWNTLTNIRNAYNDYCILPFLASHEVIPLMITTQPYRSRIKIQRFIDLKQKYLNIIASFIKRILQYSTLTDNDYNHIKNNFQILLSLNTCELMKSNVLKHLPWENDRLLFELILSENLLERLETHIDVYQTFSPYDSLIMKLFIIILALTGGISPLFKKLHYNSSDFEPFSKEIFSTQNYYLTLLWKYVIYRLDYRDAIMYSVRFIQHFLHRQTIEADLNDRMLNRDDHEQLFQIIQTTIKI